MTRFADAPLALAHLSALETPPADLATFAAAAGFASVGLRLHPAGPGMKDYLMSPGSSELKDLISRLNKMRVRVHDAELVPLTPDLDVRALEPVLAMAQAVGARRLNVSGDDPDRSRLADTLAALAEQARAHSLVVDLEFMRWRHVATIHDAADAIRRSGSDNVRILLDCLHLHRSGGRPEDLSAEIAPLIGSVQLCDAPFALPPDTDFISEARGGRSAPGDGELPLKAILDRLPPDVFVGVEVPPPGGVTDQPDAHIAALGDRTRKFLRGLAVD